MMSFRQMSMGFLMHDLPVAIGATSTFISVASISELSAYSSLTPPIRVAQAGNMALAIAGRQWSGTFEMAMRMGAGRRLGITGSRISASRFLPCSMFRRRRQRSSVSTIFWLMAPDCLRLQAFWMVSVTRSCCSP